jgi:hypothetical protein
MRYVVGRVRSCVLKDLEGLGIITTVLAEFGWV